MIMNINVNNDNNTYIGSKRRERISGSVEIKFVVREGQVSQLIMQVWTALQHRQ